MSDKAKRGRPANFTNGKEKKVLIGVHRDFEKQTKAEIKPILEKYHLKPGETESELIKRIQQMNLDNSEKEALKK